MIVYYNPDLAGGVGGVATLDLARVGTPLPPVDKLKLLPSLIPRMRAVKITNGKI